MDVIERFIELYWARYGDSITMEQRKALGAIFLCRSVAMGGHRYVVPGRKGRKIGLQ